MMRHLICVCLVVVAAATAAHAGGPRPGDSTAACDAITRAVTLRMGASAAVTSCVIDRALDAGPWAVANPDLASRLGNSIWFTLQRAGATTAPVRVRAALTVTVEHGRATHVLPRGTVVSEQDVLAVNAEVTGVPLARVPVASELIGARVVRVVDAGAVVLTLDVTPVRLVKAGERVVATVRIGTVEVSAAMTAVDAGAVGDIIRVSNRDTRRVLQARVVGAGRVEVVYER
jgi:flagella basal body P-ring formation protein FlgA